MEHWTYYNAKRMTTILADFKKGEILKAPKKVQNRPKIPKLKQISENNWSRGLIHLEVGHSFEIEIIWFDIQILVSFFGTPGS